MPDILHRVGIKSSVDEVYKAITTIEGLSSWWVKNTQGETNQGRVTRFGFDASSFDIKVIEMRPPTLVRWEVIQGPREWVGTTMNWELKQEDDFTIILFKHEDWREAVEFMHHCSTKWAVFLLSLKSLVESGKGAPDPEDVKIDNWG